MAEKPRLQRCVDHQDVATKSKAQRRSRWINWDVLYYIGKSAV